MPSILQLRPTTMIGTTPSTTAETTPTTTAAAEIMPSLAHELAREMETVARFHNHKVGPSQCCSAVVRRIAAPIDTVWGLVRRFDQPQTYKHFLRSCRVIAGDGAHVGCLREVHVVSGLPAASSTEKLEVLDEDHHAIGFCVVGGEHRLHNYRSVTTLHPSAAASVGGGEAGTVVVESYVVDIPEGNTKEETCMFVDTIVRCNLQSLSQIAQRMSRSSTSSSSSSSSAAPSSSSCKVS